jgi:hypothetical protein
MSRESIKVFLNKKNVFSVVGAELAVTLDMVIKCIKI